MHPQPPADQIRNFRQPMQYRRFGRSERWLSVITLGGMRFHKGWEQPRDELLQRTLDECRDSVLRAFDAGINHIETAYGYGKSEHTYGRVLNQELAIPRQRYHLMTKGSPKTAEEVRRLVDEQLRGLQTDHIDLYGWHGINDAEAFDTACAAGGPVEELLKLRDEGVIGTVGFSTHGPTEVICRAIETDLFDFVNLHYYYFWQRNWPAVYLASRRDMGVFIISPNDKGGQLWHPYPTLREICAPLTPIQWNARFCLRTPLVQTLSFGMHEAAHFDEMRGIFPVSVPLSHEDQRIQHSLDARVLDDPYAAYDGYDLDDDPSQINIAEILRFRRMWKCYGMLEFCRYRYNMFNPDSSWFRGAIVDEERLARVDTSKAPADIPLIDLLREAHEAFYVPKE